jgi:hypothetical protein
MGDIKMYTLSVVKDNINIDLKETGRNGVEKLNLFDWLRSSGDFL